MDKIEKINQIKKVREILDSLKLTDLRDDNILVEITKLRLLLVDLFRIIRVRRGLMQDFGKEKGE